MTQLAVAVSGGVDSLCALLRLRGQGTTSWPCTGSSCPMPLPPARARPRTAPCLLTAAEALAAPCPLPAVRQWKACAQPAGSWASPRMWPTCAPSSTGRSSRPSYGLSMPGAGRPIPARSATGPSSSGPAGRRPGPGGRPHRHRPLRPPAGGPFRPAAGRGGRPGQGPELFPFPRAAGTPAPCRVPPCPAGQGRQHRAGEGGGTGSARSAGEPGDMLHPRRRGRLPRLSGTALAGGRPVPPAAAPSCWKRPAATAAPRCARWPGMKACGATPKASAGAWASPTASPSVLLRKQEEDNTLVVGRQGPSGHARLPHRPRQPALPARTVAGHPAGPPAPSPAPHPRPGGRSRTTACASRWRNRNSPSAPGQVAAIYDDQGRVLAGGAGTELF